MSEQAASREPGPEPDRPEQAAGDPTPEPPPRDERAEAASDDESSAGPPPRRRRRRRYRLISPTTLLVLGAAPAVVCGVLHLLGTRQDVALLAGTAGDQAGQSTWRLAVALVYVLSFLGAVLLTPIAGLAAVIWWVLALPMRRRIRSFGRGAAVTVPSPPEAAP